MAQNQLHQQLVKRLSRNFLSTKDAKAKYFLTSEDLSDIPVGDTQLVHPGWLRRWPGLYALRRGRVGGARYT